MIGAGDAGMAATAKHFPGHGAVPADSHLTLPVDRREMADLHGDLMPYRRLIATCYHEPDWAACTSPRQGRWRTLQRTWGALRAGRRQPMQYGAWDGRDLRASLGLLRRSIRRTRQASRIRRQQGL